MSERYSKLFTLPENLYAAGSPVVIAAGALLKDNQSGKVLAQIKLRSISPKTIKAVTVAIYPMDTVGKALGDAVVHQYLDLSANRNGEFAQKQPVVLPDASTRAFSVEVKEVIFSDNDTWTGTADLWEALATAKTLMGNYPDGELQKQYHLELGIRNNFIYTEAKDLWYCSCGALNRKGESHCHSCQHEAARLRDLDWDALNLQKEERLAAEAAQAKAEAEQAAAQAKKTAKITGIVAAVIAVIIAGTMLTTKVIIPFSNYRAAEKLLESGQFQEAIAKYEALGEYKDSAERLLDAKYAEAEHMLKAGQYEEAIAAFVDLGDHKDSVDRILEARYGEAEYMLKSEQYDEAIEAFEDLGDYKDSATQALDIQYNQAKAMLENGQYKEAYSLFKKLGDYSETEQYLSNFRVEYTKLGYTYKDERFSSLNSNSEYEYNYDDSGLLIKRTLTDKYGKVTVTGYSYNRSGLLIKIVTADADGTSSTTEHSYDDSGLLLKTVTVSVEYGIYTTEYTYDASGLCIKEVSTDAEGEVGTYEYSYDNAGLLIKEVHTSTDSYEWTSVYSYDDAGLLLKEVISFTDGDVETYRYSYDSSGVLIEETDTYGYITEYTYDENGLLVKKERSNSRYGSYYTYNYSDYVYFYQADSDN